MPRKKSLIPGFSLKRATGVTKAKQKIARATGVPTTKEGRKNKLRKKLLPFLVISLLLIGALASAEGFTPSMFLGSRGLMVMDENQLNSMGSSEGNTYNKLGLESLSYGVLGLSHDDGPAAIVFSDGEKFYLALDMTSMFGSATLDDKAFGSIFVDFCKAYDFDLWMIGNDDTTAVYVRDTDTLSKLLDAIPEDGHIPENITHDKDEFIESVKAKLGI